MLVLREFFGLLPGQTLAEFVGEVKLLGEADRAELETLAREGLGKG